jgi:hypothetical protein
MRRSSSLSSSRRTVSASKEGAGSPVSPALAFSNNFDIKMIDLHYPLIMEKKGDKLSDSITEGEMEPGILMILKVQTMLPTTRA